MDNTTSKIQFLITEYEKLKDEQKKRIEFRDHMIYITLAAIGGVFTFAIEKPEYNYTLLVLPFVCIILGWSFLTNDKKVSDIGDYIVKVIIPKLDSLKSDPVISLIPSWEEFHKNVKRRKTFKIIQLSMDLMLFSISGLLSIIFYLYISCPITCIEIIVTVLEIILLIFIMLMFFKQLKF